MNETIGDKEKLLLGFIGMLAVLLVGLQLLPGKSPPSNTESDYMVFALSSQGTASLDLFGEFVDRQLLTDLLVEAIIQQESGGNPRAVGSQGERGLMQIMAGTWADASRDLLGKPLSFDRAFDPRDNIRIGSHYLTMLQTQLTRNREQWQSDERSLLLAAYNAGPAAVRRAKFDIGHLNSMTQGYVTRVIGTHNELVRQHAPQAHQTLMALQSPENGTSFENL